ncbi:MAG: hypothetical protein GAK35_02821 [Herbaspirillum frisingense]|uniref:Uncharacterized protein n=1 Tax=Herbaspirillum frisingense TaxID=92645 RepID=A0A7V8JTE9_9BURK|nr:MAG: hypothetical protein GAK35_02821 [Herbaspirillum frisingense]
MKPITPNVNAAEPVAYTSSRPPIEDDAGARTTLTSRPGTGVAPAPINKNSAQKLLSETKKAADAETRRNITNDLLTSSFEDTFPPKYPAVKSFMEQIAFTEGLDLAKDQAKIKKFAARSDYAPQLEAFVETAFSHKEFKQALDQLDTNVTKLLAKHLPNVNDPEQLAFAAKIALTPGKQAENPKLAWQASIVADLNTAQTEDPAGFQPLQQRYAELKARIAPWSADISSLSVQVAKVEHLKQCVQAVAELKIDAEKAAKGGDPALEGGALEEAVVENVIKNDPALTARFEKINKDVDAKHPNFKKLEAAVSAAEAAAPGNAKRYEAAVTNWLQTPVTLRQINQQLFDNHLRAITLLDVRRDDILVRKEIPPQSVAHSGTLPFQEGPINNGILNNKGDTNVFHIAMVTQDPPMHLLADSMREDNIDPKSTLGKKLMQSLFSEAQKSLRLSNPTPVNNALQQYEELKKAVQYAAKNGVSPDPERWKLDDLLQATIQIGEARGGLGTTNAMRVLLHSLQSGTFHVYRAPDDAAFNTRGNASLMTEIWGNVQDLINGKKTALKYSTSLLGGSMLKEGKLFDLNASRRSDIKHVAGDPEKMTQEVDITTFLNKDQIKAFNVLSKQAIKEKKDLLEVTPEEHKAAFIEARAKAAEQLGENTLYLMVRGKDRLGGETCSTVKVRAGQVAKQQEKLQEAVENKMASLQNDVRRELGLKDDAELPEDRQKQVAAATSEWFKQEFGPFDGPFISEKLSKFWDTVIDDNFGGILQGNAEATSPRTVEGLARSSGYHDLGVLTIGDTDVFNPEQRFDAATGKPVTERFNFTAPAPAGHGDVGPSGSTVH